jgi:hypothetical protein
LRLARRVGVGRRLIGEGADEHGRGGRAPRDRAKASNSPVRHNLRVTGEARGKK